jgi:hypothetical protein
MQKSHRPGTPLLVNFLSIYLQEKDVVTFYSEPFPTRRVVSRLYVVHGYIFRSQRATFGLKGTIR